MTPRTWGSPASRLADLILANHPDENGHPRVTLTEAEQRRILAWIDLNVPYYDSSETAYPEATGCRRIYPEKLDAVLAEVAARRCVQCHTEGLPRKVWTRIEEAGYNAFLHAPLAREAGGAQRCGEAVFRTASDPDYTAILATFKPAQERLRKTPRMDMANAHPAASVCRERK